MIRALYTAASGMSAQQANLDTVANNLANSATSGFKQRALQFEDMIYQNMVTPGSTGNPYDLAIQGAGFFQVQMPNGTLAYTRDGNFSLNNAGLVVDANGDQLIPALTIPSNATSVTISTYGVVTASLPGQTAATQLGQIQLATFPNPGGLSSQGSNLFLPTSSSGNAITDNPGGNTGMGTLQQGYLENSNVDVVTEFVQMILAQRAYESNSKVIHTADDMYSQINGLIR
jgi:flagellar basal-body rod protein FlgG